MLYLICIHVCVVSNAVQRISESEGSLLEAHFSARWNPELLISYLIHQNGPALAGHHLSEMCLQKHVFINHFPFSVRYTVVSGLKWCSWELGVAVLDWWGRFGGCGGGGMMIFTSATGSSLHPYISLLLPSLACSCSSLLLALLPLVISQWINDNTACY